jgi:hypothetical protein
MITLKGDGGRLWVGWHLAATLGPWTATREAVTFTVTYQAASVDPFWATQPVTRVDLPVGREWLIWHTTALDGRGTTITLPGKPDERQPR